MVRDLEVVEGMGWVDARVGQGLHDGRIAAGTDLEGNGSVRLMHKVIRKQGVGVFACILVLVAIPVGFTWRAVYLDKLNYRLISAVKANDTGQVIDLLARGADANSHDDPPRKVSLWQRLQEALHLKQKPLLKTPSALCLALEWRPDPSRAAKPTIEDTPLIRALMSHGARQDAPEIIARMERTYAFCSTYQDTGNLRMTAPSEYLSFRTAFVRPNRLYFEYTQLPQERYLLWENDKGVHSWMTRRGGVEEEESLVMGIAGATGISLGTAALVPGLLVPEQTDGWGGMLPSYPDARLVGIKTVEGVACYEIIPSPKSADTVYVDRKTFLLREEVESDLPGSDQVTLYHPQVNVPISESTFQVHPPK